MRTIVIAILFVLALFAAQPATAKGELENAKTLIKVSGVIGVMEQAWKSMLPTMEKMMKSGSPDIPGNFFPHFREAFHEELPLTLDEFAGALAKIYAENFSQSELRELVAFYQSPIGKKIVEKQPVLTQSGMVIGQKIGAELGGRVYDRAVAKMKGASGAN